ncbi:calcium-binding protein [Microvirga calopogonii]|uniref:calcium-binding protein n=1 Tax=Microvirga calopogonii TaxID=2078013 RepID=UPI000E0D8421|nr:calcium-binding protein [Microvirga calopogonii]
MAVVTFTNYMRPGLRLQDFLTVIVGSISYGADGGLETATFKVDVDHMILDIVYRGLTLDRTSGQVSSMEVRRGGELWLTYASDAFLFDYDGGLASFHERGAVAAASIMQGSDHLTGTSQGDYLEGYTGDDHLDGGQGADTLDGGAGNDTYIVDNRDDRVFETVSAGYDVVYTSVSFAMAADAEIEELRAAAGASSLSLIGNDLSNFIVGTSGNDELDGKGGGDTLIGGAGDDLYYVDSSFDVVVEDAGQGRDTVIAYASFALSENVEVLKAAGGYLSISLTGNALSNEIFGNLGANTIDGRDGDDFLYGDGGNDVIYGGNGQDVLYGGIGEDFLSGGDGDDYLYGDVGNDTLDGGAGHDVLYGGTGRNRLLGQGGNDTLYGGMNADTLLGGDGNDRLYGDAGNDSLDGGAGNDTLSGGWGRDIFTFKDKLNAKTNIDTITDFNVKDDTIRLENSIFKRLGKAGQLKPDFFTIGSKAQDSNDYLIYNKKTGHLYYDADGSGSKSKATLFIKLKPGLALTDKDFYVI